MVHKGALGTAFDNLSLQFECTAILWWLYFATLLVESKFRTLKCLGLYSGFRTCVFILIAVTLRRHVAAVEYIRGSSSILKPSWLSPAEVSPYQTGSGCRPTADPLPAALTAATARLGFHAPYTSGSRALFVEEGETRWQENNKSPLSHAGPMRNLTENNLRR